MFDAKRTLMNVAISFFLLLSSLRFLIFLHLPLMPFSQMQFQFRVIQIKKMKLTQAKCMLSECGELMLLLLFIYIYTLYKFSFSFFLYLSANIAILLLLPLALSRSLSDLLVSVSASSFFSVHIEFVSALGCLVIFYLDNSSALFSLALLLLLLFLCYFILSMYVLFIQQQ